MGIASDARNKFRRRLRSWADGPPPPSPPLLLLLLLLGSDGGCDAVDDMGARCSCASSSRR